MPDIKINKVTQLQKVYDDITITRNTDNNLQSIGVIESNQSTALFTWRGTIEEYNELETKDDNTTYIITNDDAILIETKNSSLPLFYNIETEHLLNDASWLRSNTFSWQYASIYQAAYNHLYKDVYGTLSSTDIIDTTTQKEITIEGITIQFYQSADKHRICLADQENNVSALYEKVGTADFYILDTTRQRFKLPRKVRRRLVRTVKNDDSSWYNLYSDGWIEQGGVTFGSNDNNYVGITLLVPMTSSTYVAIAIPELSDQFIGSYTLIKNQTHTTSSVVSFTKYFAGTITQDNPPINWQVFGYVADSVIVDEPIQYEYYYVGNFEHSALSNIAGQLTEALNNKADIDLSNVLANIDYVIESQLPTADNNYTWYRKYKSGWVEQGGRTPTSTDNATVTFPVQMQDTGYSPTVSAYMTNAGPSNASSNGIRIGSFTVTSMYIVMQASAQYIWEVKGYAA